MARSRTAGFLKSAERDNRALPSGTAKLVMRQVSFLTFLTHRLENDYKHREGNHQSDGDNRDHYTAVCLDADDQYIKTEHIPAEE